MDRLFTVEEANALLPRLVSLLESLQASHNQYLHVQQDLIKQHGHGQTNGKVPAEGHFDTFEERREHAEDRLRREIREIESIGCVIKDLSTGLLDFPSMRDGRVVYLCWKLGEPEVAYWHDLDVGFAGRQPLD